MLGIPNTKFSEVFYGYCLNKDSTHNGKSLPITSSDRLLTWIGARVGKYPELRITDVSDNLVMHIVDCVVLFPTMGDGRTIRWDLTQQCFVPAIVRAIELPRPISSEAFLKDHDRMRFKDCVSCRKPFSDLNVKTPLGWKETQISGMCETCFDNLFADKED